MSGALGKSAGYEAIQQRHSLAPLLDAAVKAWHTRTGCEMLGGLLEVACEVLDACQAKGVIFELSNGQAKLIASAPPAARRLLLVAACQHLDQAAADLLSNLAGAIYSARDKISIDFPKNAEPPKPPVTLVKIVGMPDRTTTTEVARSGGAIVGSISNEQDA